MGSPWEESEHDREDGVGEGCGGVRGLIEVGDCSLGMTVGVTVCVWCGPRCVCLSACCVELQALTKEVIIIVYVDDDGANVTWWCGAMCGSIGGGERASLVLSP